MEGLLFDLQIREPANSHEMRKLILTLNVSFRRTLNTPVVRLSIEIFFRHFTHTSDAPFLSCDVHENTNTRVISLLCFLGRSPLERTWTLQDYRVNCDDKKIEGLFGENNFTKVEKKFYTELWGCGSTLTFDSGLKLAESKYKRSKNVFAVTFVALTVVRHCAEL